MSSVSTRPHPDTASKQSRAKSDNAFRTISEVAEELHVPQHVLRFWETRFAQVKPMKRGGNRRYYRPEDVDLLRAIRGLLYEDGYTIKGVQKLFRERGVRLRLDDLRDPRRITEAFLFWVYQQGCGRAHPHTHVNVNKQTNICINA